MRLYSTPESVNLREVSFLAICETLGAMGFIVFLFVNLPNPAVLFPAIFVVPLLLLKTDDSIKRGVQMMDRWDEWAFKIGIPAAEGRVFALLSKILSQLCAPSYPVAALYVRIYSTAAAFFANPGKSLRAVPGNWFTLALCSDTANPPEIVAGYNARGANAALKLFFLTPRGVFANVRKNFTSRQFMGLNIGSVFAAVYTIGAIPSAFVLFLLPSVIYRISVKSTSILWFPVIWIAEPPGSKQPKLETITEEILSEHFKRVWAGFVLVFLTLIPLSASFVVQKAVAGFAGREILIYWVPIDQWGIWNFTRVGSAVITLLLYSQSRKVDIRIRNSDPVWNRQRAHWRLKFLKRLRLACVMTTIFFGAVILSAQIDRIELPVWVWWPV